jgi:hypothetical protein
MSWDIFKDGIIKGDIIKDDDLRNYINSDILKGDIPQDEDSKVLIKHILVEHLMMMLWLEKMKASVEVSNRNLPS